MLAASPLTLRPRPADDQRLFLSELNMAVPESVGTMLLVMFLLLASQVTAQGQELESPTPEIVLKWANAVNHGLYTLNRLFGIVLKAYQEKVRNTTVPFKSEFSFHYEPLDEVVIVKEMADSLFELMGKHVTALEKSVEAAEKLASDYKWNNNLRKDDVSYMNAKELNEKKIELTYKEEFRKEVNFEFSAVHIPVEIYDGNIDILNGLNWTAGLDKVFKENRENDTEMLWQYFGSQTGFLRFYPAAVWPKRNVDLYDVRRRSWYTQGSSSPKDMMILIDTSGSTHGQSLQLMRTAVKSILDTLGENDYVNIVHFAEQASFVSKCFNHNRTAFVQANYRNKQRLMKDIDLLNATGQANFIEALTFAFERFKEFSENATSNTDNIGANCNKVIMLLTDGGTDDAEEVFRKYNWPNRTVRVFTYAVGATPNPIKALRWMACANRGFFSQIPAMGAIRAKVQEYTSHLNEMEEAHAKHVKWEITIDPRRELGMMTTVTRPVYNYSRESSNQTILGVMAIDVTTSQLEDKTPLAKIGPNGYSFAINPNGYVVFHPNLHTAGKFLTEPPNIDLLELEVDHNSVELNKLRSDMIEGVNGSMRISTYFISPEQRYVISDQADYAYVSITNSSFRLGLCVPTYQKVYPNITGNISLYDWSSPASGIFEILIAPWRYHKDWKSEKDMNKRLDDIKDKLISDPDPDNWNLDLLNHLYWDFLHIDPPLTDFLRNFSRIENKTLYDNDTYHDSPEETRNSGTFFIMTNGGMTLVSPPSAAAYFEPHRNLRESAIFKRALRTTRCIFMADYTKEKRPKTAKSTPYVITARGAYIDREDEFKNHKNETVTQKITIDKPAVIGERLKHEDVIKVVYNASMQTPNYKSCNDSSLLCYLVDDGGFLVATTGDNYEEQIGLFFGQVDPPVFDFINRKFFNRTVQYDFQSNCTVQVSVTSSGFKEFHIPTTSMLFELLNVAWWTSKVHWVFNSFNLYSMFTSSTTQVYANDDDDEEVKEKKCLKATYQYYVNSTDNNYTDTITCQNCTRNFTAVKLNQTNLIFIVVDKICDECDRKYLIVEQAPKEINETDEEKIVCLSAQNPRKRVRAYECHHSDPREDTTECGCTSLQVSYLAVLLIIILVTLQWAPNTR